MQTSIITAKIKLLPSDEQMVALAQVRTLYTKACNWLSAKVYKTKELGQIALHNAYYQQMRAKLGIKAQMTQSVIKTVIARYKSAKSNNHPWIRIEFSAEECDLVYNRDYSYNRNRVHKSNRNKREHRFECRACHYKSNDDRVGAMNLYRKGIEKISELLIPSSAQQVCPIEQGQSQLSQSLTKG